jgi:hypothetical protein
VLEGAAPAGEEGGAVARERPLWEELRDTGAEGAVGAANEIKIKTRKSAPMSRRRSSGGRTQWERAQQLGLETDKVAVALVCMDPGALFRFDDAVVHWPRGDM